VPKRDKLENLTRRETLNPNPQTVTDELFAKHGFFDGRDIVQVKYEMLRRVAKDGQPIEEAIHAFGFSSCQAFYKARAAFEHDGLAGLVPSKRCRTRTTRFVSHHLEIDFNMRSVRAGDRNVRLTPKEFDLLCYLVQAKKTVPHRELLQTVWGPHSKNQIDYLRVVITRLRKKIEPNPAKPRYIITEPWVGYRFMASSE
jgi:DNA-binding response OmpR family regulator